MLNLALSQDRLFVSISSLFTTLKGLKTVCKQRERFKYGRRGENNSENVSNW